VSQSNWDVRFLQLADMVSTWSKDPSTKVGAVIVDDLKRVLSLGYNGLPRGIQDTPERLADRDLKYKMVVHAEANAILNSPGPVRGSTLYLFPLPPCSECSKLIIQSGIRAVRFPRWIPVPERWRDAMALSEAMLLEAGVDVRKFPL
jgi:dCMP deaminase